ncbi:MAG: glycosyltransferase [Flavobacterium sp.]
MLSILIPTYNYNAFPLVQELCNQAAEAGIIFEIIVLDDASTNQITRQENLKINTLTNCWFEENQSNLGRGQNLNILAEKANYDWLLILDTDTFPKNAKFISNYIATIPEHEVIFGGIAYQKVKPKEEDILRWKYGSEREEIDFRKRKENPFETTLTSNILISKAVFNSIKFDSRITNYGYEDLVFINNLRAKNHTIHHIDNPTYHLNYETSEIFLNKTKEALETLIFIEQNSLLAKPVTKIQLLFKKLQRFNLAHIIQFGFLKFQKKIEKHLLSKNPRLMVFDFYKLGYYITLKLKS